MQVLAKLGIKKGPGIDTPATDRFPLVESRYKYEAKDFEEIITDYKNRKPNKYPDLDALTGDMGGEFQ